MLPAIRVRRARPVPTIAGCFAERTRCVSPERTMLRFLRLVFALLLAQVLLWVLCFLVIGAATSAWQASPAV